MIKFSKRFVALEKRKGSFSSLLVSPEMHDDDSNPPRCGHGAKQGWLSFPVTCYTWKIIRTCTPMTREVTNYFACFFRTWGGFAGQAKKEKQLPTTSKGSR